MTQLDPIVNQPSLYVNGCLLQSSATLSVMLVTAGELRDSNNVIDMNLGNFKGLGNPFVTANSTTTVNLLVNGLNGLDTGTIAASTFYYFYVIGDSSNKNPVGTIASTSSSAPTLPFGYDSFRLIGYNVTDGSSHFITIFAKGQDSNRYTQYASPVAVTVTSSGTSATYSAMDFSTGVPPLTTVERIDVMYKWTPAAAGNILNFTPSISTFDFITTLGIVAAVAQQEHFTSLASIVSGLPKISYKISAGTLNNVYILGYNYNI